MKKAKASATKQDDPPSEVVRKAIQELLDRGVTLYRVAKDAGVAWQVVQRFMQRRRGLSLISFDLLCRSLDLELRPRKRP